MTTFERASQVIDQDQAAVVLFTRGPHFTYDSAGNGSTGKWVVNLDRLEKVDKVIIYLRDEKPTVNRIYLGNYIGTMPSDDPHRQVILFACLEEVGTTEVNWLDFAGSGQNPVSYVAR